MGGGDGSSPAPVDADGPRAGRGMDRINRLQFPHAEITSSRTARIAGNMPPKTPMASVISQGDAHDQRAESERKADRGETVEIAGLVSQGIERNGRKQAEHAAKAHRINDSPRKLIRI